jgi:hypothetical protein
MILVRERVEKRKKGFRPKVFKRYQRHVGRVNEKCNRKTHLRGEAIELVR